jgi:hypothetical protein
MISDVLVLFCLFLTLSLDVASFLAIAYTSSLTVTVAGNFKAVINIVISVIIFQNEVSPLVSLS